MESFHLRCEYLENPIGIDVLLPRLSWKLKSNKNAQKQTAYQIQFAENQNDLKSALELYWDTGKITSEKSIQIEYDGPKLHSHQKMFWRVKVWNKDDEESEWSDIAWWEMGLLKKSDFIAEWIDPELEIDINKFQPCPHLRKDFNITKEIEHARLYITCHGLYEAWINGKRVGNQYFTPGRTVYEKRLQYQTYDVTNQIVSIENDETNNNTIGVILGDGWFRGSNGSAANRNVFGERLALLCQIWIKYKDGTEDLIITDETWQACNSGPIIKSDVQWGETYDANKELTNWNNTDYLKNFEAISEEQESKWHNVKTVDISKAKLVASNGLPIKELERIHPKILHTPNGETILDFQQNLAGYVEIKLNDIPKNTKLILSHGEALDPKGNFTQSNMCTLKTKPYQIITYIHDGKKKSYKPRFTIHGFQYVKLEGFPGEPEPDDFSAIAVYSNMEQTGDFKCSQDLINKLVENTRWSQKGNFLDIPTDCPTRERSGWTGDAQAFCFTGSMLMNTAPFLTKWMRDVAIQQDPDGKIHNITPRQRNAKNNKKDGAAGWGDASVIVPYRLWQIYGDKRILETQYESMKKWVKYEQNSARDIHWSRKICPKDREQKRKEEILQNLWDTKFHWGEWLEASVKSRLKMAWGMKLSEWFSEPEVATAFYAYSTRLLSKIASILNKKDDSKYYAQLSEKITYAYQQYFFPKGNIKSDKQAKYVRPLALGLVQEKYRAKIASDLNNLIIKQGYQIGTGFLSTPFLCEVLSENGHLETAYKLLEQTNQPSWLFAITKGANTIWESWYGINKRGKMFGSLNHYSYGAVVGWLFKEVVGIRPDESNPGYKHFIIKPEINPNWQFAEANFDSPYGLIRSRWDIKSRDGNKQIEYKIEVPCNTSATIILKNSNIDKSEELSNGTKPLSDVEAIDKITQKGDKLEFTLKSGNYYIRINQ